MSASEDDSKARLPRTGHPVLERGKTVGAVSVAIAILDHLAEVREPQGVSRIAQTLGFNNSTTFNTLRTLVAHDYLAFDETRKTYRISVGLLRIARAATFNTNVFDILRSDIDAPANRHRVTIAIWKPVRSDRKVLIHSFQPSTASIRIQMSLGARLPLLVGSSGRLFAAFGTLNDEEMRNQFREIRWQSAISYEDFLREVEAAGRLGYAIDNGDFVSGTVMVSVPILDGQGHAVMSMSAMMFPQQLSDSAVEALVEDMQTVAARIGEIVSL